MKFSKFMIFVFILLVFLSGCSKTGQFVAGKIGDILEFTKDNDTTLYEKIGEIRNKTDEVAEKIESKVAGIDQRIDERIDRRIDQKIDLMKDDFRKIIREEISKSQEPPQKE